MIYAVVAILISGAALFGFSVGYGLAQSNAALNRGDLERLVKVLNQRIALLSRARAGLAAAPPDDAEFDKLLRAADPPAAG